MLHIYLAAVLLSLTFAMVLEMVLPLHREAKPPLLRWFRNLALSALAVGVTVFSSGLFWTTSRSLGWTSGEGVLTVDSLPIWGQWLLTFLLLDGVAYALHRFSHSVPALWRLHAVHHTDLELDATTTHRHHPAESLLSVIVTLPLLLVLAPPVWAVIAYSVAAIVVSTLSHSSLALPDALDKLLRKFMVTPAYHRAHHSAHQIQTDSNYATVFPLFDLLFSTASPAVPDKGRALTIGLETSRDPSSQTLGSLLLAPFRRRRETAVGAKAGAKCT